MMDFWDRVVDFAEATAVEVGLQLLGEFGRVNPEEKPDGSLVTRADMEADLYITQAIAEQFPDHGCLSEEGNRGFPDKEWCWVVDPLDGTTNFSRGIPLWGISLALLHRGIPVFGYLRFPPVNQSFSGFWYGNSDLSGPDGAFLNDRPLELNHSEPGRNQLFSFCSRSMRWAKQPFPCKIRMLGVASYNLLTVVSGTSLGAVEAQPKVWDMAGVWAIAKAAGATWTPLSGPAPFPLEVGCDYTPRSFPTLITARQDLAVVFRESLHPV